MRFTKRNASWFLEGYQLLNDVIVEYYFIYYGNTPDEVEILNIDDNSIVATCSELGQHYPDPIVYHKLNIPVEYLWIENWQDIEYQKILDEKLKAIERQKNNEREQKEKQEARDHALYIKLKEKFEPTPELLPFDYFTTSKHKQESLGKQFQQVLDENYWGLITQSNTTDDSVDNM